MRRSSVLVALLVSLALYGCGGAKGAGAKAPEKDPWSDYKGTFATGVPSDTESKASKPQEAKPAAKTADAKPAAKAADAKPAAKTADAKPVKVAEAKPSKTAEPATSATTTAATGGTGEDARAMYGVPSTPKSSEGGAPAASKKVAAKKKPGAKKAPKP